MWSSSYYNFISSTSFLKVEKTPEGSFPIQNSEIKKLFSVSFFSKLVTSNISFLKSLFEELLHNSLIFEIVVERTNSSSRFFICRIGIIFFIFLFFLIFLYFLLTYLLFEHQYQKLELL